MALGSLCMAITDCSLISGECRIVKNMKSCETDQMLGLQLRLLRWDQTVWTSRLAFPVTRLARAVVFIRTPAPNGSNLIRQLLPKISNTIEPRRVGGQILKALNEVLWSYEEVLGLELFARSLAILDWNTIFPSSHRRRCSGDGSCHKKYGKSDGKQTMWKAN